MFPGTLIPKRIIFATVVSKHDALAFQKGKLTDLKRSPRLWQEKM